MDGDELRALMGAECADPAVGSVGAYAYDLTRDVELFQHDAMTPRVMASTVKLFSLGAALDVLGPETRLRTTVVSHLPPDRSGTHRGDLYIVGGGDPTLGSATHVQRRYGGVGTTVDAIADLIHEAGVRRIGGSIVGDGSRFDHDCMPTGRLGALTCNRKQTEQPELYAAQRITTALRSRGITVAGHARAGEAPANSHTLGAVESPPVAFLVGQANKHSDNFVSEMLTKALAAAGGEQGTTRAGAHEVKTFARRFGVEVALTNGSGLTYENRGSPYAIAQYLSKMRHHRHFRRFFDSLAVAGQDGTLFDRMRNTRAQGHCYAKTGTLPSKRNMRFSALAGYCQTPGGSLVMFTLMMDHPQSGYAMLSSQDRVAVAIAHYSRSTAQVTPRESSAPESLR